MRECFGLSSLVAQSLVYLLLNPRKTREHINFIKQVDNKCVIEECHRVVDIVRQATEKLEMEPINELEIDYTRLFIAAYPRPRCPPYESFYKGSGRLLAKPDIVEDLSGILRRYGLSINENIETMPDNFLVELELASIITADPPGGRERNTINRLFYNHIIPALPKFADCIQKEARNEYYKLIADALKGYVSCIKELL